MKANEKKQQQTNNKPIKTHSYVISVNNLFFVY